MGFFHDDVVDHLLDLMFSTAHDSFFPADYDVALSTTLPADDGTGVTEPVGGSYARVEVPNDDADWPAASARAKSNALPITFPQPTGSWGTVGWYCLYDHGTSTFRCWGALATPRLIDATSQPPQFNPGQLVINAPG